MEPWRAWTLDGCRKVGGYVTRYRQNFDYLTIRGRPHGPAVQARCRPRERTGVSWRELVVSDMTMPVYVANGGAICGTVRFLGRSRLRMELRS